MKNSVLEYKGYHTAIEFDNDDFVLKGKIEGIKDLVYFESKDADSIEKEFHDAVDDYLEFCKEVGKTPEKEYKGTFNVRISPELHKKLAFKAIKNGESLNSCVEKAIENYVDDTNFYAYANGEMFNVSKSDLNNFQNSSYVASSQSLYLDKTLEQFFNKFNGRMNAK